MSSLKITTLGWLVGGAIALLGAMSTGCNTEAFCFSDCKGQTGGSGGAGTGTSGTGGNLFGGGGHGGDCVINCATSSSSSSSGPCMPTNGGIEICDKLDNDCNGSVDDVPGLDLNDPKSCGTCDNNCYTVAESNWDPLTVTCTPSGTPGTPGTCKGSCTQDYFDLNADGTCEYYCVKSANDDAACNNKDDDCDGQIDEDVNLCTDLNNCGACNKKCQVQNGTAGCQHTGMGACDTSNTKCVIAACDPGWNDIDGSYATGCEYPCTKTNGGVEICDGIDNDCNGQVDDGIPSVTCQGGTNGVCADPANAGMTQCVNGQVSCVGANVVKPGEKPELCNNLDDDCDGVVDDNPTDAGAACGMSNIYPCTKGTQQCQNGMLVCVGAINPGVETCNGVDDDCDGTTDNNLTDVMGQACDVPIPPPAGATSPCMAGTLACVGGVAVCQGSVKPAIGATDTCGVDANCDGTLTNQPNTTSDVNNCGMCGNSCLTGAVHANWACVNSVCVFQGCQAGYYDNGGPGDTVAGDNKCGYACTFVSQQEACNGADDNCNGTVDEGVVAPSPVQVCGVSPSATAAECTTGVSVACQNGAWKCTFPAGVCNPTCAGASEICDGLDNDCDGLLNENVANYGQPCNSDDGLPFPGHGACKTSGTIVCNGANATKCSAVKANCSTLPGGCTELCDGIDNDCDGSVDETFQAKGTDATYFVKPAVTKIGNALWVYSYEASRPNATNQSAGTGNGYTCNTSPCPGSAPVAPANTPLEKTKSCSAQGKIPWFNVTPIEAEQVCVAMGGRMCTLTEWQTACDTNPPSGTDCKWGYAPRGAATCSATFNLANRYCNLGPSFDFDSVAAGDQDGLLVTGSPSLKSCYSDWNGLQGNPVTADKIFDTTGNLREIAKDTSVNPAIYKSMGGSFASANEDGAQCSFSFYSIASNFSLYDLGFRCCFTSDPTL